MSSIFNHSLGHRLRQTRKLRGLTQQQLAELLNISFQQVQKYESGVNTLSFERVCHLSTLLGVALPHWLEQAPGAGAALPVTNSRQELILLQALHRMGDAHRRLLCKLAQA